MRGIEFAPATTKQKPRRAPVKPFWKPPPSAGVRQHPVPRRDKAKHPQPLSPGDTVQLTLEFDRAGSVTVDAEVATYLDIADRLLPPRLVIPGQNGNPAQPGQTGGI